MTLKNEDDIKNEDDLKNNDILKNEDKKQIARPQLDRHSKKKFDNIITIQPLHRYIL